jgi:hypothetical protein
MGISVSLLGKRASSNEIFYAALRFLGHERDKVLQ